MPYTYVVCIIVLANKSVPSFLPSYPDRNYVDGNPLKQNNTRYTSPTPDTKVECGPGISDDMQGISFECLVGPGICYLETIEMSKLQVIL